MFLAAYNSEVRHEAPADGYDGASVLGEGATGHVPARCLRLLTESEDLRDELTAEVLLHNVSLFLNSCSAGGPNEGPHCPPTS